jgi:hypothetical protein
MVNGTCYVVARRRSDVDIVIGWTCAIPAPCWNMRSRYRTRPAIGRPLTVALRHTRHCLDETTITADSRPPVRCPDLRHLSPRDS